MRTLLAVVVFSALLGLQTLSSRAEKVAEPKLVSIPGATFIMGTPIEDENEPRYHADEAPLEVTVEDFSIGQYPVTAEELCLFLNSAAAKEHDVQSLYNHENIGEYEYSTILLNDEGKSVPRAEAARAPANQVTWKGAVLYCQWLSKQTGKTYRLPSEAEWELAARGEEQRPWPWGEGPAGVHIGERYDDRFLHNSRDLVVLKRAGKPTWSTTAVGSHPANATPEGVHDLLAYIHGEWCANKYVGKPAARDVVNTSTDLADLETERVIRGPYDRMTGNAWVYLLRRHGGRAWTREHGHPVTAAKHAARFGFRLARDAGSK